MLKEFKQFALKGNIMDMAIGVVIGGAFQKIVNSLVNDIIMPAVSILTGKVDFTDMVFTVGNASIKIRKLYNNNCRFSNNSIFNISSC